MVLLIKVTVVTCFQIVAVKQTPIPTIIGQTTQLKCITSDSFEFCCWRRHDKSCSFIWNLSKSQICGQFGRMVKFIREHHTHECSIEFENTAKTDEGIWSCEIYALLFIC